MYLVMVNLKFHSQRESDNKKGPKPSCTSTTQTPGLEYVKITIKSVAMSLGLTNDK